MIGYHARWVVPVSSPPIPDGTVVEDGGRIVYVGPRAAAPRGENRELGDVALLPGLVNAHTHLELTAMRGALEDLAFPDWIGAMRASRDWLFSNDVALDAARWGVLEGFRSGTTTFGDASPGGASARAMSEAGARGIVFQEVFGPDPAQTQPAIAELDERVCELRRLESNLLHIGISPHAPYTVSDDLLRAGAQYAAQHGLRVAIHVAESESEGELIANGSGGFADSLRRRSIAVEPRASSPVELLRTTGVLSPRTLLVHCVHLSDGDIATVASTGAAVAHCPVSNAKLGHGIARVLDLRRAGVTVGLGTDSVASNNRLDVLDEARMAVLLQRAITGRYDALDARTALRMATLDGARALGLDSRIGSLETGKDADLAAFDLSNTVPTGDLESALIFALYERRARFVAIAGRPVVEDGRAIAHSDGLRARVQTAADELSARLR